MKDEDEDDDDDRPLSQKKADDAADNDDDDESEGEGKKGRGGVRDRRSRERRRKDRDRKRREEKKASETGGSQKKGSNAIDDSILDKADPHEVMEVYGWPMPLPEDAGRVRAYGVPGQTHEFWETYEQYFCPVTEEDVKRALSEPDLEHDPCFLIPKLGTQKGAGQAGWDGGHDDGADDDHKSVTTSSGRVVGGKRKAPEGATPTQKMALRMLASLIPQDGVASGGDAGGPMVALQAAADAASRGEADLCSLDIEQCLRIELTGLGLMEAPDIEYDHPSLREDDQICVELRHQQEALRRKIADMESATSASRKALLQKVEQGFAAEKIHSDLISAAKTVESCIMPKFKLHKGVKTQEVKKHMEVWDKALARYRSFMANPNRRKPTTSGSSALLGKSGEGSKHGISRSGGGRSGGWGGSASAGQRVAEFHSSIHRKHH